MHAVGEQRHVDARSGSIHNDVPVKPTCPNARGDIRVPHDDVGNIVSQPSARELPGISMRRAMNVSAVVLRERSGSALEHLHDVTRELAD